MTDWHMLPWAYNMERPSLQRSSLDAYACCVVLCVLQCGTTPGWLDAFSKCAETLEAVQKGLEDYLETKRVAFPR
jgi:hypothetical protein